MAEFLAGFPAIHAHRRSSNRVKLLVVRIALQSQTPWCVIKALEPDAFEWSERTRLWNSIYRLDI
jgi:hypothetical protein